MTLKAGHLRPFIIGLWLAVLFLPFKGLVPALVLFATVTLMAFALRPMRDFMKAVRGGLRGRVRMPAFAHAVLSPLIVIVLFVLPVFASDYVTDVAVLAGIYIILALGLNVVIGFAGLLNLGFAAFYAIGAYSYALLNVRMGLSFWHALPLSLAITTVFGFILAVPALRLRGDYLAIVTLGFGEITRLILNNWDSFTNGPNGISGIAQPYFMGIPLGGLRMYYYVVLVFAALTAFVIKRVYLSRIGRAWTAMREDEIAASAMGINTTAYKLYAFAFGAFWAGLSGVLYSAKMQFVSPESFTFMESVFIVCMVILGGMGSITGVVLGAVILVALPEAMREAQMYRMLAVGIGLVLLMIFRPQGIFGRREAGAKKCIT